MKRHDDPLPLASRQLDGLGLFDGVAEGRAARDQALDGFEDRALLATLRLEAERVARERGQVSANEIRHLLPADLSRRGRNIMGAVFRGRQWQRAGWTQSTEPAGHARWIQVWVLDRDAA